MTYNMKDDILYLDKVLISSFSHLPTKMKKSGLLYKEYRKCLAKPSNNSSESDSNSVKTLLHA